MPLVPDEKRGERTVVWKQFFRLTFLNVLTTLTTPLAGLVDLAMLGHLDHVRHLAGVALAAVIFDVLYWGFGFLRMGTTALTARAVGRLAGASKSGGTGVSNPSGTGVMTSAFAGVPSAPSTQAAPSTQQAMEDVRLVLTRAVVLGAMVGLVFVALRPIIDQVAFALLAGTSEVERAGSAYFKARILGAPAALTNMAILGWYVGRGRSGTALLLTLLANLTNVVLNYIFIVRLGWASAGAGLATMAGQYLMMLAGAAAIAREGMWSSPLRAFRVAGLAQFFSFNRDVLIRTVLLIAAFTHFTNESARMGDVTLAANVMLIKYFSLAAYLVDGAALAVEAMLGHLTHDRAQRHHVLRLAFLTGGLSASVFLLALNLTPHRTLGLLTHHQHVVERAVAYLGWMTPSLLAGSMAFILDGVFLGLTAGRVLRVSAMVSFGCYVPAAFLAHVQRDNNMLWLAFALFMVGRAGTLGFALWQRERAS